MTLLLRSLLLLTFALFWGGLTFYTGIAVRIAHDVLSDPMEGGLITQRVTSVLQLLGVVSAVLMLWNAAVVWKACRRHSLWLLTCAVILSASLVGLFVVHGQLDAVISVEDAEVVDREKFVIGHRRYNQLTTVEWISSLLYLPITISAWRIQDQRREPSYRDRSN